MKELIREADLTYRELGERIGVTYSLIAKWNKDGANPKLETMIKLARELNVSFKVLAHSMGKDTTGIPDDTVGIDQTCDD